MRIVIFELVLLVSSVTAAGCSERSSSEYPSEWPVLDGSLTKPCKEFQGDYWDQGVVAEPKHGSEPFRHASLSGLIRSGSTSAPSTASHVRVSRLSSGAIHTEPLSEKTTRANLLDDRCATHSRRWEKAASCDSGGSVSLCFFVGSDGSLIVKELARQPDVAWLVIPVEEEYEYWYRFPLVTD
jgi:hypothetical protein